MLVQAIPLFQDAHLLRRSMLEALSDYAFLTNQYLYKGYSEGILAGCNLTATEDTIVVNEGIVVYGGQLFLIKEPMSVSYYPTNVTTILKMRFSDEMRDANFIYREVEMVLTKQTEVQKGEIELCRFKLQEGARLRYRYQDFEDRNTEFDTLNIIHAPFAAPGKSTLSSDITKSFARQMLLSESISYLDEMFCIQILSQERAINREALRIYLERRNKIELDDCSNLGIYKELSKILKEGNNKRSREKAQAKKEWRLTVE